MLGRTFVGFSGLGALLVAGMLGGCIITTGTGGSGGSSSTTSAGTGGETTGTTTTTTGTGGTGGVGGDIGCVGDTGPKTVADCDTMNITPTTHGGAASPSCGPNLDQEPPGYLVCVHAFSIFTSGAASDLQECLATIGVQDQCTESKWQDCVDAMYADACPSASIVDACKVISDACGADPFDSAQCAKDLNPFSNDGLGLFQDCFNGLPNDPCQTAYDSCLNEVLSAGQ